MKPNDLRQLSHAQIPPAFPVPSIHGATPPAVGLTVSTQKEAVTESTAGQKRSLANLSGGATSSRREPSKRALLHQAVERQSLEKQPNQDQSVCSFQALNPDALSAIHSFLTPRDRSNHLRTCKTIFDLHLSNQRVSAGLLGKLPTKNLELVVDFLNSKDISNLALNGRYLGPLKKFARQCRVPTQGEIDEMTRDPQDGGQKFVGKVKLPSSISDAQLSALINKGLLSGVTELDLSNCANLSEHGLSGLKGCTSLRSLDLSGCRSVTRDVLKHLRLLRLEHLSLRDCGNHPLPPFSYGPLWHSSLVFLTGMPLKSLDLSNCTSLTTYGLNIIMPPNKENFRSLESLSFSGGAQLSPQDLGLSRCINLKTLDLSGCTQIDDRLVQVLQQLPARLTTLNISNCPAITPVGRASLIDMKIQNLIT